ncbi:unnamed protein product [Lathyrus oleraceus]
MAQTVKFINVVIIIVLFLFISSTNIEAWKRTCFKDSHCPDSCRRPKIMKCVFQSYCKCVMPGYIAPP